MRQRLVWRMPSSKWFIKNKTYTPPRLEIVWRAPADAASHGLCMIGGGGVLAMGTAINVVGMEDIENLCRKPLTRKLLSKSNLSLI